ncbi:two-component system, OmpR family, sensor histidine kinase VanS [Anaerorhabdus furcosa]|uniref:histidine kinase n=1 Tax=Anaerorhabdus furcosa TaxID=118967 RepID=A0A1T4P5U1_9FIRM|nr:two-component system, OmpR family, sensor histidine kinase VanS [Anaerorhabdus furcosa]
MNKKNSQLANQIILHYIVTLLAFILGIPLLIFIAIVIASSKVWYANDPLYQLLRGLLDYFVIIIIFVYAMGIIGITVYYMKKPIDYMGEVVDAASTLVNPTDEILKLSKPLKSIEDELNLARVQGLRNSMVAKESEQRKNDLVIYLAHDLKTPLTSILGYLSLLKDEPDLSADTRARYTNIALDKAERLEYLVNEFFDITRFNLTTQILQSEKTNLSVMIEQISYEFLPVLKEKNLEFDLHIEPFVEYICDANKLERVFDNLIRNAINYSYQDSSIQLYLKEYETNIEIKVINKGKTIPKEIQSRVFEQFFRLDSSRQSTSGGTGLGLAIAKEIVELHQGTIELESENEMIEFKVSLPKQA